MGSTPNRKRKRARVAWQKAKKFKDGEQSDKNPWPSKMTIGDVKGKFGQNSHSVHSGKEGTIFMDMSVLFGVFEEVLKCPVDTKCLLILTSMVYIDRHLK